ncbi:MAG: quinolinate synthase NadA, partial [Deltaproteobacteria bacterium]|nr:quinolinate synthase NadA [Deltaproteobacteria bacterium]
DAVLSTSGMLRFAEESQARAFIVGTEEGLLYPLKRRSPDKAFFAASEDMICKEMKKTTLKDLLSALETMTHEVRVPRAVREKAVRAVDKMLALSS